MEFVGSVSGLRTGSVVSFNGIRVGRVSGLGLDAHDPHKVVATISVERALPVRADTKVALTYQGLTGLAEVALTGGAPDAALVVADNGGPPTLYAQAAAGADVTQTARDVLSRIAGLIAENETALRSSLHNIETVTSTLATNEFIRRFLIHVLPKGFHRIRHYGLLGNTNRAANIAAGRS